MTLLPLQSTPDLIYDKLLCNICNATVMSERMTCSENITASGTTHIDKLFNKFLLIARVPSGHQNGILPSFALNTATGSSVEQAGRIRHKPKSKAASNDGVALSDQKPLPRARRSKIHHRKHRVRRYMPLHHLMARVRSGNLPEGISDIEVSFLFSRYASKPIQALSSDELLKSVTPCFRFVTNCG
ncbi:hypothetical protein RF11_02940 [Thelohanellus kitauei]|uniref:Uncharacterized protein n=1 Tax=Thelohanellus kitauei TaxID=669202 RepID=A0A0C2J556_THEKT|nr:hypothetical protein RF11_02940 [Thelohanellus kitauei]